MISSLQTDCSWNNFNPNTQLRHDCGHSSLCDLMCNSHMHINQAQQSIDEASLYYNPSTNCIWTMITCLYTTLSQIGMNLLMMLDTTICIHKNTSLLRSIHVHYHSSAYLLL